MPVKNVDDSNFEDEVINSDIPVLLDFWAEWCGPCKSLLPVLDELSDDLEGKLKIVKINVDKNNSLAIKFSVKGIPTLLLMKEGKVISSKVGSSDKESLKAWIESN